MLSRLSLSLSHLLAIVLPTQKWLLANLIAERSIGMIAGPRGCGKSLFVLLLAYAIAAAKELFPWGRGSGGCIVYYDAEMRINTLADRLKLIHAKNIDDSSIKSVLARFHVISRDHDPDLDGTIDSPEGQQQLENSLPPDCRLLIIDNLSAATTTGSETGNAWANIKTWLIKLRKRGIATLLIHHAGKNGHQRGTSAHEDLLDYSILLTPLPNCADHQGACFEITHTKLREFCPDLGQPFHCHLWSHEDKLYHLIEPGTQRADEREAEILHLAAQGLKQVEIAKQLGVSKFIVSRTLSAAKKRGPASS